MMPQADQDALLAAAVGALEPGGVILVREADASAGWRFQAVRIGNRLTALASGRLASARWHSARSASGASVSRGTASTCEGAPAGAGTPFANHLFRLTARQAESAATVPREQSA